MFGKKITAYLGTEGNNFILNGKQADLNPEEVYNVLTAPCWGTDVVYDAPHAKFMEQKRVREMLPTSPAPLEKALFPSLACDIAYQIWPHHGGSQLICPFN